jgi:hypothetical protein
MTSIYQRALGDDFSRLHPQIQRRFGFSSEDEIASIGRGVMSRVWHGAPYTLPFLYLGAWRRIMFPDRGTNVPFTVLNYAFVDPLGRETVTWIRTFEFSRTRRFDAYMVFGEQRGTVVDYLGSYQHLAVDLALSVDERGGLCLRSSAPRFYERMIGIHVPLFFSGVAEVCEWYDESIRRFCIDVNVYNDTWGPLFGYRGTFDVEWCASKCVPTELLPLRYECRE